MTSSKIYLTNKWRKFQRLAREERFLLVKALFLIPLTGLGIRLFNFTRLQNVMAVLASRNGNRVPGDNHALVRALTAARMVQTAAGQGLYRANCLPQSLVLWWLLKREGIEGDLRIGVSKERGRFEAHAWVECRGVPLNQSNEMLERYAAFERGFKG